MFQSASARCQNTHKYKRKKFQALSDLNFHISLTPEAYRRSRLLNSRAQNLQEAPSWQKNLIYIESIVIKPHVKNVRKGEKHPVSMTLKSVTRNSRIENRLLERSRRYILAGSWRGSRLCNIRSRVTLWQTGRRYNGFLSNLWRRRSYANEIRAFTLSRHVDGSAIKKLVTCTHWKNMRCFDRNRVTPTREYNRYVSWNAIETVEKTRSSLRIPRSTPPIHGDRNIFLTRLTEQYIWALRRFWIEEGKNSVDNAIFWKRWDHLGDGSCLYILLVASS